MKRFVTFLYNRITQTSNLSVNIKGFFSFDFICFFVVVLFVVVVDFFIFC